MAVIVQSTHLHFSYSPACLDHLILKLQLPYRVTNDKIMSKLYRAQHPLELMSFLQDIEYQVRNVTFLLRQYLTHYHFNYFCQQGLRVRRSKERGPNIGQKKKPCKHLIRTPIWAGILAIPVQYIEHLAVGYRHLPCPRHWTSQR